MLSATLIASPFHTPEGQQYLRAVRDLHPYIYESMNFHQSGPARIDDAQGRGFTMNLYGVLPDVEQLENLHAAFLRFFDLETDFAPQDGLTVHPDSRHTAWFENANGFTPVSVAIPPNRAAAELSGSYMLGYTRDGAQAALFFTPCGANWPQQQVLATGTLREMLAKVFSLATDSQQARASQAS